MARWSLRTKLVAVLAVTFLPIIALSGVDAHRDAVAKKARHVESVLASAEIASSGHRQLLEGSRRLLMSACSGDAVQASTVPIPVPADVERCDAYFARVIQNFPTEYSALLVTDSAGQVRCSSAASATDRNLGDRQIFKAVRDTKKPSIGATIASRITRNSIVPLALPVMDGDRFLGMCALGLSIKAFDLASPASANAALVDGTGAPLGGRSETTLALPIASRVVKAISDSESVFTDYGQNGQPYEFHILPLAGNALFTIAAVPIHDGLALLLENWGGFGLIVLFLCVSLLAVAIGADRWCVRPLNYIQGFAARVARGEKITLVPPQPWTPEMLAVAKGINEMAEAIASRESELRSGLEQRDHMLREIHHRVKNNLQMISSLLNLQAGEIRSPRLRRFFGDAQNRVLTLSILHRHLYERSSWSLVDFQQFISDLVRQITVARPKSEKTMPRYQIRAPTMAVGPDTAIPVGLIVTEAVSSALNHDFSGVGQPEIRIEAVQKDDENAELIIEDNGLETEYGSIQPQMRGGFGVTLVRGLAMQLGGEATIETRDGGGVRIVVAFPLPKEQETDG
jgi:two-component sensor histidine kinase